MLNGSLPKSVLYTSRHLPLISVAKVIKSLTEMGTLVISELPHVPLLKRFRERRWDRLHWQLVPTFGAVLVVPGVGDRPLLYNTSTTCGGWSLETHRIRFPWVSRSINPYWFLIERDTGLGQLESFLVYFWCMMAASVRWTPSLLGTTLHSSANTSTRTTGIAGRQKTWRNLILDGCACSLDSKSTHQAFLQSNVSLSRKTLQGL